MKTYWVWIRRTHRSAFELLRIVAANSYDAILALPACVCWNFSVNGGASNGAA